MSKLLAPLHNMSLVKDFQSKFGLKSSRSGGASAAGAANIPFEVWGSHGGWQSRDAQLRYMEISLQQALQVSTAVTSLPFVDPETLEDSSEEDSGPDE